MAGRNFAVGCRRRRERLNSATFARLAPQRKAREFSAAARAYANQRWPLLTKRRLICDRVRPLALARLIEIVDVVAAPTLFVFQPPPPDYLVLQACRASSLQVSAELRTFAKTRAPFAFNWLAFSLRLARNWHITIDANPSDTNFRWANAAVSRAAAVMGISAAPAGRHLSPAVDTQFAHKARKNS